MAEPRQILDAPAQAGELARRHQKARRVVLGIAIYASALLLYTLLIEVPLLYEADTSFKMLSLRQYIYLGIVLSLAIFSWAMWRKSLGAWVLCSFFFSVAAAIHFFALFNFVHTPYFVISGQLNGFWENVWFNVWSADTLLKLLPTIVCAILLYNRLVTGYFGVKPSTVQWLSLLAYGAGGLFALWFQGFMD